MDLDLKIYNDFLSGEKQAFEYLYNKYKNKTVYFIHNIVKDYQKAEDIAQETFIYIMQNRMKSGASFKYYLYLVAKSKAFNYINLENRRNEIAEEYLSGGEQTEKDVLDIITREETKKELLESIDLLDEKYKNAVYLVNIEGFSYKETADILGESLSNTKSLVHRGKLQLRKILLKKGFKEMNKAVKVIVIIAVLSALLTGIAYAGMTIYDRVIKTRGEVQSRGLFDLGDGHTYYEINLMANDMTWNDGSRLYHRIIEDIEDYEIYKSRIDGLPDAGAIDFDEAFVVIIANENVRQPHEKDLTVSGITADRHTTHVIMKQKENPDYDSDSNVWYAVADRALLRDSADVTIEQRAFDTRGHKDVKELPRDYGEEDAIKDGCMVLRNNAVISGNIGMLDDFMEKTENGENSFIRIYSSYESTDKIETRIKDLEYCDGIYYLRDTDLNDPEKEYYNSFTGKLKKTNNKFGTEYSWMNDDGITGFTFLIIQGSTERQDVTQKILDGKVVRSGTIDGIDKKYIRYSCDSGRFCFEKSVFSYFNGRICKEMDPADVGIGDYVFAFEKQIIVFRNISGEELNRELLYNLTLTDSERIVFVNSVVLEDITVKDKNTAVVKIRFWDIIGTELTDESFTATVEFNSGTKYFSKGNNIHNVYDLERNAKRNINSILLEKGAVDKKGPIAVLEFESTDN